jgi:hypothetical protein
MMWINKTPFRHSINTKDNDRVSHRKASTSSLATIFEGDDDTLSAFNREFSNRMTSVVLDREFYLATTMPARPPVPEENAATKESNDKEYAANLSNWNNEMFLRNESATNVVDRSGEWKDWISSEMAKLNRMPLVDSEAGSEYLMSQQHRMWIAELNYGSVNDDVRERLANHEETHDNDGVVMWAVLMQEFGSAPKDTLVEVEMNVRVEKLHLTEHGNDITKLTAYMRLHTRKMINSGHNVAPHHYINLFDQLIVVKNPEFQNIIVTLFKEWRLNSGEGFQLGMSKLLNKIDGDVRRISKGGTDIISGDDTAVLAMQAQIDDLKKQVLSNQTMALIASSSIPSSRPSSAQRGDRNRNGSNGIKHKFPNWPKKEEKQTCEVDGTTYMYCGECPRNRRWNTTHFTDKHVQGYAGENKGCNTRANMTLVESIANSSVFQDF